MNVFHLRFSLVASVKVSRELLMQTCWWPLSDHWSVQPTSPHLSGFVFYGCLESLTELSALCTAVTLESPPASPLVMTNWARCTTNDCGAFTEYKYPPVILRCCYRHSNWFRNIYNCIHQSSSIWFGNRICEVFVTIVTNFTVLDRWWHAVKGGIHHFAN